MSGVPRTASDWDLLADAYHFQEPLEWPGLRLAVDLLLGTPSDGPVVDLGCGPVVDLGCGPVVDLGCGPGTVSRMLVRRGHGDVDVIGVDQSPRMLALARRAGVRPVRGDVTALPLASGTIRQVMCAWVLHLLDPTARRATVAEVARVLTPGGRAVLVVPATPLTPSGRWVRGIATTILADGVLDPPDDLDDAVCAAGLVVRGDRRAGLLGGYASRILVVVRPDSPRLPRPTRAP